MTSASNPSSIPVGGTTPSTSHSPQNPPGWNTQRRLCIPCHINRIGTWNVEGLRGDSIIKLDELIQCMGDRGIDALCMQETHLNGAEYYMKNDFKIVLSGSLDVETRTYASVGFLVSPKILKSTVAFKAFSDRLATLRIKVKGGM